MRPFRLPFPRRGANAIEFGLTVPVFFAMLVAVVDYGWWFGAQAGMNNAVSLGCREGSMVDATFGDPMGVALADIQSRAAPWCGGAGCTFNVEDRWEVPEKALDCSGTLPFTPLIGLVPTPSQVFATSTIRLEWQRDLSPDTGGSGG